MATLRAGTAICHARSWYAGSPDERLQFSALRSASLQVGYLTTAARALVPELRARYKAVANAIKAVDAFEAQLDQVLAK